MKTLFIGDVHGRTVWKDMIELEDPDRVIFIGDYFDSKEIPTLDQISNFEEIVRFQKTSGKEVITLIGNHDFHYFPGIEDTTTSGYRKIARIRIQDLIEENRANLKIAYRFSNILCTHAGVSSDFMDKVFEEDWTTDSIVSDLEDLFRYKPFVYEFGYLIEEGKPVNPYGDDKLQSPIWIRERSLFKSNKERPIKKELIQIYGHTGIKKMDIKGKSTGGRYYNIDTLGTSLEYIIHNGDSLEFKKLKL